ncbi:hypothetical protein LNQ52_20645 [Klebsiella pneumoniae subsp. pneumoniae]|nr:hypothetical protein [Klebsiella pneumoniae subsp. pneumoniae]
MAITVPSRNSIKKAPATSSAGAEKSTFIAGEIAVFMFVTAIKSVILCQAAGDDPPASRVDKKTCDGGFYYR